MVRNVPKKEDNTGQINKILENTGQFPNFSIIQEIQDVWEPCNHKEILATVKTLKKKTMQIRFHTSST